jgi:hypothetical protein
MMTNTNNVRLAAANMLLDRGVRYTISGAPLSWQLLRLNRIKINPLKAGTIIEISRIIDENKLDKIETVSGIKEKLDSITLLVAVSILNNRRKIKYFSPVLSKVLLWKIPLNILLTIFYHIVQVNHLADFTNITRYFAIQAQMMMDPKNMGQQATGN